MIRTLKRFFLRTVSTLHLNTLFLVSRWRQQRLLILCYHGTSLDDDHNWAPGLFMPISLFEQRLQWIKEHECTVLPLGF
jgi:hypothetical protein